jgi:hypothetical protein
MSTKQKIYKYECMGDTLEFAESLGWEDTFPADEDEGWDAGEADACEEEAIDFIRSKGYIIQGYQDE